MAFSIGIVGAFVACLLVGMINGWLIAYLGVNPFVATLGAVAVVRGLIYVYTNASPRFGVPYSFTTGLGYVAGIPIPAINLRNRCPAARLCAAPDTFRPLRLRRRRECRFYVRN